MLLEFFSRVAFRSWYIARKKPDLARSPRANSYEAERRCSAYSHNLFADFRRQIVQLFAQIFYLSLDPKLTMLAQSRIKVSRGRLFGTFTRRGLLLSRHRTPRIQDLRNNLNDFVSQNKHWATHFLLLSAGGTGTQMVTVA